LDFLFFSVSRRDSESTIPPKGGKREAGFRPLPSLSLTLYAISPIGYLEEGCHLLPFFRKGKKYPEYPEYPVNPV
jgi:hypothetical protein